MEIVKGPNKKQSLRFHVMAKPAGPMCNLDYSYCFYLHKESLLSTCNNWRMCLTRSWMLNEERPSDDDVRQHVQSFSVCKVEHCGNSLLIWSKKYTLQIRISAWQFLHFMSGFYMRIHTNTQ